MEPGSGDALKEEPGDAGEESGDDGSAKGLPVLKTEPADGAATVRPDAAIRIVFDTGSKAFKHVSKQLEKGHFYVTLNGRKVEAAYNGKDAVEAKPGLLQRYTDYAVEFVLHPDDQGKHLGFGNGEGKEWENKTYRFSFKTGSALHEPKHARISVSSARPRVTEGAELELAFADDYGQPGWGARGRVILTEQGSKPDTAAADPFEFTVPEGSDGKVRIRVSDTEAEKVSYRVEVSGPYPEDAAQFDGEIAFRPGPAAKVSLSIDKEKVVAGQKVVISGAAEDVYGNPVEDGTPVSAGVSAGQVSGASTSGGAFALEFTAPTKKQIVILTAKVDQAEAKLDVPVVADVPAKVTVTPEKQRAAAGSPVKVEVFVEDQYGNPVEDGTRVTLAASGGSVSPSEAATKDGLVEAQVVSDRSGEVAVTASAENGASGSASVAFVAVVPPGSQVTLDAAPGNAPGEYVVEGQVTKDGMPVPSVAVPLAASNGVLSDPMPVTDQQGGFSVALKTAEGFAGAATVTVDGSLAPGVAAGTVGVDPLIYGSQPWTDTGIDVGEGLLVRVSAQGSWASELYAKVGDGGTPVKVGADGGFVTGIAGRLYLGPYAKTYADNLSAVVRIDDPIALGFLPSLTISANPTALPADGQSKSTVSGYAKYGQYPAVTFQVRLSASLGTIASAATTSATGYYSASFTAGTTVGTGGVTASLKDLTKSVSIQLTRPEQLVKLYYNPGQKLWYKITKDNVGFNVYYSSDNQTWTKAFTPLFTFDYYGPYASIDIAMNNPNTKEAIIVISRPSYWGNYTFIFFDTYVSSNGYDWQYRSRNSFMITNYRSGPNTKTSLYAIYSDGGSCVQLFVSTVPGRTAELRTYDNGYSWQLRKIY